MKRLIPILCFLSGCSILTPDNVKHAEEAARITCIITHAFLPSSSEIAKVCHLTQEFIPLIDSVASEHRAGVQRALSGSGEEKCK